jgi:hypothetical protein
MNKKTKVIAGITLVLAGYITLFFYFPAVAVALLMLEIVGCVGITIYKDNVIYKGN